MIYNNLDGNWSFVRRGDELHIICKGRSAPLAIVQIQDYQSELEAYAVMQHITTAQNLYLKYGRSQFFVFENYDAHGAPEGIYPEMKGNRFVTSLPASNPVTALLKYMEANRDKYGLIDFKPQIEYVQTADGHSYFIGIQEFVFSRIADRKIVVASEKQVNDYPELLLAKLIQEARAIQPEPAQ